MLTAKKEGKGKKKKEREENKGKAQSSFAAQKALLGARERKEAGESNSARQNHPMAAREAPRVNKSAESAKPDRPTHKTNSCTQQSSLKRNSSGFVHKQGLGACWGQQAGGCSERSRTGPRGRGIKSGQIQTFGVEKRTNCCFLAT